MYAAGLADVFTEALQNSRRAGATRVSASQSRTSEDTPGALSVTVTDDGAGIADPAVLLSFGENGWSEDLARREDAAGMGFLSLARRGCTVVSRPRSDGGETAPAWRVDLTPAHFLGRGRGGRRLRCRRAQAPRDVGALPMTDEDREAIRRATRELSAALPAPGHARWRDRPPPGFPRWRRPCRILAGPRLRCLRRLAAATGTSPT